MDTENQSKQFDSAQQEELGIKNQSLLKAKDPGAPAQETQQPPSTPGLAESLQTAPPSEPVHAFTADYSSPPPLRTGLEDLPIEQVYQLTHIFQDAFAKASPDQQQSMHQIINYLDSTPTKQLANRFRKKMSPE